MNRLLGSASSSEEDAGETRDLPMLLAKASKAGFYEAKPQCGDRARHTTAIEALTEQAVVSSHIERQFQVLEWSLLQGKLEGLFVQEPCKDERAAGRLLDDQLNGYFSLGAHFTLVALSPFQKTASWRDGARKDARRETVWCQDASAQGLTAWTSASSVTQGAVYGYGSMDASWLLPVTVQHDRSRCGAPIGPLHLFTLKHASLGCHKQQLAGKGVDRLVAASRG